MRNIFKLNELNGIEYAKNRDETYASRNEGCKNSNTTKAHSPIHHFTSK